MSSQKLLRNTLQSLLDSDLSKNELKAGIALVIQTIGYGKRKDSLTMKRVAQVARINIKGGIDRIEKPLQQIIDKGVFGRKEHRGRNYDFTYSVPDRFFEGEVTDRFFAPSIPVSDGVTQSLLPESQSLMTYRDTPYTEINQYNTNTDAPESELPEQLQAEQPIVCDVDDSLVIEKPEAVEEDAYRKLMPALKTLKAKQAGEVLQLVALATEEGSIKTSQIRLGGGLIRAAKNGQLDTSRLENQKEVEKIRLDVEAREKEWEARQRASDDRHLAMLERLSNRIDSEKTGARK